MPPNWKYFKPEEVTNLDTEFVSKLDLATAHTAQIDPEGKRFPFIITSGFRTPEKEQSLAGGCSHSAHSQGLAVDLQVSNDHEVYLVLASTISVGIDRFGIYVDGNNVPTHVHVDVSKDDLHVPEVIWIRKEGAAYNSGPASA